MLVVFGDGWKQGEIGAIIESHHGGGRHKENRFGLADEQQGKDDGGLQAHHDQQGFGAADLVGDHPGDDAAAGIANGHQGNHEPGQIAHALFGHTGNTADNDQRCTGTDKIHEPQFVKGTGFEHLP